MELDGLSGRTALVTGAAKGIGRVIAETLCDLGANVAACDIAPAVPDGPETLAVEMDVTDEASVDAGFQVVEQTFGPVDVLILNAGVFRIEPLESTTLDSWRFTMHVNLDGPFLCCRRALPSMRQRGFGRIVAIGSSAGKTGGAKDVAAYAASKAGLMALMKAIASEYAGVGITANALAPALIDTDMIASMGDLHDAVPVGRLGRPQEVADLVAYLSSEHSGFITGEVVDINGGFLID